MVAVEVQVEAVEVREEECRGTCETAAGREISGSNIAGLIPARLLVCVIIHALPVQSYSPHSSILATTFGL